MLRLLGILVTVLFAIAAAVVTWPQFFRLERAFPFTQLVSMRGLLVLACAAIVLVALLLCIARPIRAFAGAILTTVIAAVVTVAVVTVAVVTAIITAEIALFVAVLTVVAVAVLVAAILAIAVIAGLVIAL